MGTSTRDSRGTAAEEVREARASCLKGKDGIFPGGHGVQREGEAAAHQQRGLRHLLLPCFCHGPLGGGDGHCEECWELNNANVDLDCNEEAQFFSYRQSSLA